MKNPDSTPQMVDDPKGAYMKKQHEFAHAQTLDTIDLGKAESVVSKSGTTGIRISKEESSPSRKEGGIETTSQETYEETEARYRQNVRKRMMERWASDRSRREMPKFGNAEDILKKHFHEEEVVTKYGVKGARLVRNEEIATSPNREKIEKLNESSKSTTEALDNVRGSLSMPPSKQPPASVASNNEKVAGLEAENQKMKDDPTYAFLRSQGFNGETGITYSIEISGKEGKKESKKFSTYAEMQKFLKANPDALADNRNVNEMGFVPYRTDFSDAVYEWSAGLAPEQLEKMLAEQEALGDEMVDVKNFTPEMKPEGKATETGNKEKEPKAAESPESVFNKFQNFESHKNSAERIIRCLQQCRNDFENSNDISGVLGLMENAIAEMTQKANPEDLEKLHGHPIDLTKETEMFGIDDNDLEDYNYLRDIVEDIYQGKPLKTVLDSVEKYLGTVYGVRRVEVGDKKTTKELISAKLNVKMSAVETDDPSLIGTIKEVRGVGYDIPNVPIYSPDKKRIINTVNKDLKTGPSIVVYRSK